MSHSTSRRWGHLARVAFAHRAVPRADARTGSAQAVNLAFSRSLVQALGAPSPCTTGIPTVAIRDLADRELIEVGCNLFAVSQVAHGLSLDYDLRLAGARPGRNYRRMVRGLPPGFGAYTIPVAFTSLMRASPVRV